MYEFASVFERYWSNQLLRVKEAAERREREKPEGK
jgi:hypothetical protein